MNMIPNETTSGWSQTASTSNRQWSIDSSSTDQWLINGNLNQTNQNSNRQNSLNNNQTSNISSSNSQLNLTLSNSTQNLNSINQNNQSNSINDLDSQMTNNWSQLTQMSDCQATAGSSIANTNLTSSASSNNQLDSPTACQNSALTTNQTTSDSTSDLLINKTGIKDEILYSLDWGSTPIDQNTPWDYPSNHQVPPKEIESFNGTIDNTWRYSMATIGTEIWESNIRKKSITLNTDQTSNDQQKNNSNWNSPTNQIAPNSLINHLGGTWGEDDHLVNSNKMLWNQPSTSLSNGNSNPSIQNNNWLENEKSNGWINGNEDKMNTWNSNSVKDYGGWSEQDPNSIILNDNLNDDGTSLWNSNNKRQNGTNQRWKDNDLLLKQNKPNNNLTNQCANGSGFNAQNNFSTSPNVLRLPNSVSNPIQQSTNKVQTLPPVSGVNWNDQKANQLNNNNNLNGTQMSSNMFWNESSAQVHWGNKLSNANQDDWNNKLKKDAIVSSQQFKLLAEKGFRKESIEVALRNSNMNIKDAIEELRADALKENSNDLDKRKNSFNNHPSSLPPNSSINRNNTSQQQFNHQILQQQLQPNPMFRNNNNNNNNKNQFTANPMLQNNKNLGSLVQQIQLAVQSGHLNAQILHQPLSVGSIQLIHQLLQQIKSLQTLQMQASNMNKNMNGPNSQSELNVQITMIKQNISSLQNKIKMQQSVFINQQQQQSNQQTVGNADLNNGLSINPAATNNLASDFKNLMSPDSNNLVSDFRDLQVNNQSRLNTWKNSGSFENSNQMQGGGFSRAPGSLNNNAASNNWSSSNAGGAGSFNGNQEAWNNLAETAVTTASNGLKDVLNLNLQSQTSFINDSVPDFVPGKPWKGSQIKSSDDDPHLTPGSVNRSIISLNNFNNWPSKNSTTTNLQSSTTNTWSYNNSNNNSSNNTAISSNASTNWNGGFQNEGQVENLWQQNQNSNKLKVCGPPPGLSPKTTSKLNSWDEKAKNVSSTLMIKNLTPQIDESTLKTLCLQHGPLQNFHVLNGGAAIVKYKSKEEAIKAQSTLNNCLLSNTKIYVDFLPEESEAQNYLSGQAQQQLSNGVFLNGHAIMSNNQQPNANPWRNNQANQVTTESQWSFSNNLWNNSLDANSTMQNLLPGDLLNGESA